MGFRASWMGAKGGNTADILKRLGLAETGEIAFGGAAELCYAQLPSGWVIFVGREDFVTPERLVAASTEGEAVGCVASETVMVSQAFGYQAGAKVWSVSHDPDLAEDDLQVDGSPPGELVEIHARLTAEQAQDDDSVDYLFEAPLDLTKAVCGYRFDHFDLPGETVFKMLEGDHGGASSPEQATTRALNDELTRRVEGELYAAAAAVGFAPAVSRPEFLENRYGRGAMNVLVREKQGWWESLEFIWGFRGGRPFVEIYFFVRRGADLRQGRQGFAGLAEPRRSFVDTLLGRNKREPETIDRVIAKMHGVIGELDHHLNSGATSANIVPAVYAV